MNYYNENDPKAAAWLRELIKRGLIPHGHVDQRSVEEVKPADLAGYVQCHFFAGIGGWSYALKLAGWPVDRQAWTGSCPCQPFSVAGKGKGFADERHLWPVFAELIRQCKPPTVFGEQVASKAGREWLAGVFADLEGMGYRRAGADLCAAGVGAPHIRQRLFWMAHSEFRPAKRQRLNVAGAANSAKGEAPERQRLWDDTRPGGDDGGMAYAHEGQRGRLADGEGLHLDRKEVGRIESDGVAQSSGDARRLDQPDSERSTPRVSGPKPRQEGHSGVADHAGDSVFAPPQYSLFADGLLRVRGIGRTLSE